MNGSGSKAVKTRGEEGDRGENKEAITEVFHLKEK